VCFVIERQESVITFWHHLFRRHPKGFHREMTFLRRFLFMFLTLSVCMVAFIYVVYLAVSRHGETYDSYLHISILKKLCVDTNYGSLSSICREHRDEIESKGLIGDGRGDDPKWARMTARIKNQQSHGREWRNELFARKQVILKDLKLRRKKINEIYDSDHGNRNPSSEYLDNTLLQDNLKASTDVKNNDVVTLSARRRTTPTFTKRPLDNRKPQKCRVPKLDPFHRQAMQYASFKWRERCTLRWRKSRVEKGVLKVDLKNVKSVTLNYIKRIDDEKNWLDERAVYNRTEKNKNTEGK